MDKNTYFDAVATHSYNLQPHYQLCDPYIKLRFYRIFLTVYHFKCVSLELLNKLFFLITIPIDVIRISKS